MDIHNHLHKSKIFLENFENFQLQMLRFHLDTSLLPMRESFNRYLKHIKSENATLGKTDNKSIYFIIKKRIDLMVMHIENIQQQLDKLNKDEINPFVIIQIFDKQHIFKKVLLSHIEDVKRLLNKKTF